LTYIKWQDRFPGKHIPTFQRNPPLYGLLPEAKGAIERLQQEELGKRLMSN